MTEVTIEIIYQFDESTKEYIGSYERALNQFGQINLTDRTRIKVIDHKDGFARLFNEKDQEWGYTEDCRGQLQYSTTERIDTHG